MSAAINAEEPLVNEQPDRPLTKQERYAAKAENFTLKGQTQVQEGIVKDRKMTDVFCLFLFIAFLITMVATTFWSISKGQIEKVLAPYDKWDHFCGFDGYEEYPKMYLTVVTGSASDIFDSGICVKSCPKKGEQIIYMESNQVRTWGSTPSYDTRPFGGYCIFDFDSLPLTEQAHWYQVFYELLNNPATAWIQDLYLSSRAIYASMAMAFVYCILYIYLMSAYAEYIAWIVIWLVQISLFAGAGFAGYASLTASEEHKLSLILTASVLGVFGCVFACCLYCGYNSLKTAIDVIDAAADFLAKTKRIIFVPLVYFFVTMIFVGLWLFATISVFSMAEVRPETNPKIPQDKDFHFKDEKQKKLIYGLSLFMFFGLLWVYNFIKAKTSFIVMASASSYYFDSRPDHEGDADVMQAVNWAYFNHAGSLAFGSLIISIISFIRIIFVTVAE